MRGCRCGGKRSSRCRDLEATARATGHEIAAVKGRGYDLDDGWTHTEVGLRFSLVVRLQCRPHHSIAETLRMRKRRETARGEACNRRKGGGEWGAAPEGSEL